MKGKTPFEYTKTLYETNIPVRVKNHDREDLSAPLDIKIQLHAPPNQITQQVLTIELSDSENPYFYFNFECSEADYPHLKQELQVLIDFQQFPGEIIKLLEERHQNPSQACEL